MPRLAANLSMLFTEWSFLDRFAAAADAGFRAVEFLFPYDYPAEQIASRLEAAGLRQVLFNLPPGDWQAGERGLAALPGREAEFADGVKRAIDYAGILETPRLHMMAGLADRNDPAALSAYRSNLRYAADALVEVGLGVTIEPINRRSMPGYFLDDFNAAETFIRASALPNVSLQFDIFHRQILHGDVLASLRTLLPLIGHIQIAAVPDRHEPATGELNDLFILQEIDRLSYKGHVGCEYVPRTQTTQGLGWMSTVDCI